MSAINGSLALFRDGRRGFFGDNNAMTGLAGGPTGALVLDDTSAQHYPTAPQTQGVWYGSGTEASTVAQGANAPTEVCIGNLATVGGANSTAVGRGAVALSNACAFGYGASANANVSTAIGELASCAANDQICIGKNATAGTTAGYGIAIGSNTSIPATFSDAIVIGRAATAGKANDICLGAAATTTAGAESIAIVTGQAPTVAAAGASDVYIKILYNGVAYKLLLHT